MNGPGNAGEHYLRRAEPIACDAIRSTRTRWPTDSTGTRSRGKGRPPTASSGARELARAFRALLGRAGHLSRRGYSRGRFESITALDERSPDADEIRARQTPDPSHPPAVPIAAFNGQSSITETLDYTLRADYPGPFQVVVADDGSTDRTREIVAEYAARDPRVRLLAVEHGGKANALNAALATITAPLVATLDADTLLMPFSLTRAVARMLASPPDTVAVAGAVLVRNSRENLLPRAQARDYSLGIATLNRRHARLQGR